MHAIKVLNSFATRTKHFSTFMTILECPLPVALLGMVTPEAELYGVTRLARSNKLFNV